LSGGTTSLARRQDRCRDNASGWGWFVNPTPWEDSELATPGDQGERHRMDLLPVLLHEIGHFRGHDPDAEGMMGQTRTASTWRASGHDARPADLTVILSSIDVPDDART
jgi:hypothetical protein